MGFRLNLDNGKDVIVLGIRKVVNANLRVSSFPYVRRMTESAFPLELRDFFSSELVSSIGSAAYGTGNALQFAGFFNCFVLEFGVLITGRLFYLIEIISV